MQRSCDSPGIDVGHVTQIDAARSQPNTRWSRRRRGQVGAAAQRESLYGRRTKTSDRLAAGSFATSGRSPRLRAASKGRANFSGWAHSGIPISSVATKKTHPRLAAATVAVGWAGRRIHRDGWPPSDSGAQSAPRSRHRVPLAGRSPFIGCSSIRATHEVIPTSRSPRSSGRLSSPSRPAVCHHRAALGVI